MRILVLCNPSSGARPERLQQLRDTARQLESNAALTIEVLATESAESAQQALTHMQLADRDLLVLSGGDGTIHYALSHLLNQANDASTAGVPTVALLPAGSTNMSAMDINATRGWDAALGSLVAHLDGRAPRESTPRALVRVQDGDSRRYGFFVGGGAIVHGIEYCNNVLWAGGAARRERTAGLAMLRTIWGVLRRHPPFDEVRPLHVDVRIDGERGHVHAPTDGALLFACSTLDRLLVGVRPFWGQPQDGALPYVLVERDAGLLRGLPGLLGVRGFRRPVASRGFHSHNCAALLLRTDDAYAIDGELFEPERGEIELSIEHALRFLNL